MKNILILILILSSCQGKFGEERYGYKFGEEVLIDKKYRGIIKITPIGWNKELIYVEWIDGLGNHHVEGVDYHFISHK